MKDGAKRKEGRKETCNSLIHAGERGEDAERENEREREKRGWREREKVRGKIEGERNTQRSEKSLLFRTVQLLLYFGGSRMYILMSQMNWHTAVTWRYSCILNSLS